jgi:hypothetical protein
MRTDPCREVAQGSKGSAIGALLSTIAQKGELCSINVHQEAESPILLDFLGAEVPLAKWFSSKNYTRTRQKGHAWAVTGGVIGANC